MLTIFNFILLCLVTQVCCCLQAVGLWTGGNKVQLNPGKAQRVWVHGTLGFGSLTALSSGWDSTTQDRPLAQFSGSPKLKTLEEQMAVVARKALMQLHVVY